MQDQQQRPSGVMRKTVMARALRATVLGLAISGVNPYVMADQTSAAAQVRHFEIPGGSLSAVLAEFASQAGITLPLEPGLVQDRNSSGLRGNTSIAEGLQQLLKGTGLQAVEHSKGMYLLRPLARQGQGLELDATTINGQGASGTTENTGSYTTGATNTATRLNLSLRETPQTVSVMTRQRIDDQSLNSLTDVLEQTPGINVQHIDSERFSVYSRGYGIDNYQYDGIPTNMIPSTGATQQSLSDMAIFDRIEVVRGATGLLTGAGDPSGTINLVRKRPTAEFQGYVSAGMGSWDRYRTEMDVSGPLTDNGRLRGRLVGAYETAHSSIDWYEQNKQVFYGVLEADVTDSTTVSVGVDYQKNRPVGVSYGGLPLWYSNGSQTDFSRSTNAAARWSSRQQDTVNSFYNLEQKLANDWSLKVAANQMYSKRQNNLASLSGGFADEQTGDGYYLYGGKGNAWQKQGGLDVMLQGPFELLGRQHELVLGFNYMKFEDRNADLNVDTSGHGENIYSWDNYTAHSQFASGSEVYARYNTVIHQNGVYLATRLKPTDDLSVILGTRVSNYKYDYQDDYIDNPSWNTTTRYSQTGVVTPYAGVVYDLTDNHSVYASYTSIYKPQSYRDQSGKALDPREGNVYEFGLKSEYLGGRLNTAVALFESRQDNLAEADGLIGSTTQTAYRAVKGARTRGIDMEISGEVLPDWNVSASYSHSLTKDADNERINTVIPANMFKFWNTYRLPGELDRFTVGGGFNWQSGIHLTATPWQLGKTVKATQDDYAVFNLMGKYQVTEHLSTILNVDNLFDKQYISSMDNNFYGGYYGDPRNLMVTAKYQF